jgi:hypothetical protein
MYHSVQTEVKRGSIKRGKKQNGTMDVQKKLNLW